MDHFHYRDGQLFVEDLSLELIAKEVGTPSYIYSRATLEHHWRIVDEAFGDYPHLICYAVKANGNLGVLDVLSRLGSGFDIVSAGELERVLRVGGDPSKVVFSGVGKSAAELQRALEVGIHCFDVESREELSRLDRIAGEMGRTAPVALRVNPDVDAKTHPYIATGFKQAKFGIDHSLALEVYQEAAGMRNLSVKGIACHVGSQLTDIEPFVDALDRLLDMVDRLRQQGIVIQHLDLGGGLGIAYRDETPPTPAEYAQAIMQRMKSRACDLPIVLEPGRVIVGNAGILLTRVEYLKSGPSKNFVIVDAAMNDLARPALYDAWHDIVPASQESDQPVRLYDVVGPVCETGDVLGRDRELAVSQGDLLVLRSAGAYGAAMSSNYNARPRPAEVIVDGSDYSIVRQREAIDQLMAGESVLPR